VGPLELSVLQFFANGRLLSLHVGADTDVDNEGRGGTGGSVVNLRNCCDDVPESFIQSVLARAGDDESTVSS